MKIHTLEAASFETIHTAFLSAFSDYVVPFQLSAEQLRELHRRRGARPDVSVGVFESNALVGFTVNGFGSWRGVSAGYDAGTGVVPEARGRGLAARMMERSLELLRAAKAKRYVLEVIQSNDSAFRIYERAGFTVARELLCWNLDEITITAPSGIAILSAPSVDDAWSELQDWSPSWQNSFESLSRAGEEQQVLVAKADRLVVGYAVLFASGDLAQFAVARQHRRKRIATALLRAARDRAGQPLRIINTDAADQGTTLFLSSLGATQIAAQFEMEIEI